MPSVTSPQTVYCRSRKVASPKQMKNWLLAEFGFDVRAMEQTPRTCGSAENSAFRSGFSDPPMPVPVGSPPCAMRSEEHTSAPVTNAHLVCRLLLEKKKQTITHAIKYDGSTCELHIIYTQ